MPIKKIRILESDSGSQRNRIMKRLRKGAASTLQLRREDDVLMPAARIYELRHFYNYNIQSIWTNEATESGIVHRVCKYILKRGFYMGGNTDGK